MGRDENRQALLRMDVCHGSQVPWVLMPPAAPWGCGRTDHPKREGGQACCPSLQSNGGPPNLRLSLGEQAPT